MTMTLAKYFTPYRMATYLLLLFCVAHTAGGMLGHYSLGAESDAVVAMMKSVHVVMNGSPGTWYGYWFGFGMMVSVSLVFSAVVAWQLDRADAASWTVVAPVAWALAVSQACTAVLGFTYFFVWGPGTLGTAVTLLAIWGAIQKQGAARLQRAT